MIRLFDVVFSIVGLLLLSPIGVILYVVGLFTTGKPIFVQERVGRYKQPFNLYKFRTMYVDTEWVASHLVNKSSIAKFGGFLRKTKLDELPQLINVLKGDISLVGPRPSLYNQIEVIEEREKRGIYNYIPGITGLSQICGIDMAKPFKLAELDGEMLKSLTVRDYFRYIYATLLRKGQADRVLRSKK